MKWPECHESVFHKVLNRVIPWVVLATSTNCFSILTNKQSASWHSLIIPKRGVETDFDLTSEELWEYQVMSVYISEALRKAYNPERIGEIVSGFEITHMHKHLIPANKWSDISIQNAQAVDINDRKKQGLLIQGKLAWIWRNFRGVPFNIPDIK